MGIQFGVGGYSRTMVPIFCLAGSSSAFVIAVIPSCVITAIFLTFVMMLLFKVFDIGKWKLKAKVNYLNDLFCTNIETSTLIWQT